MTFDLAAGGTFARECSEGTLTAELRSQITDRKAELLAFLRDQAIFRSSPNPTPRKQGIQRHCPFAQERLWFLEQLERGSAVYNICRASRLTGQLNIAALEASLTEILRRHEILRSQIRIVDGRPVQNRLSRLTYRVNYPLSTCVLTRDRARRRDTTTNPASGEAPFDFATGKFLRAELLHVSNDQHVLILATHHIVSDAWSMGILTRELWAALRSLCGGQIISAQRASNPVRGFCGLATGVAAKKST